MPVGDDQLRRSAVAQHLVGCGLMCEVTFPAAEVADMPGETPDRRGRGAAVFLISAPAAAAGAGSAVIPGTAIGSGAYPRERRIWNRALRGSRPAPNPRTAPRSRGRWHRNAARDGSQPVPGIGVVDADRGAGHVTEVTTSGRPDPVNRW